MAWILSGWIHLLIGVLVGWMYRPSFADAIVSKVRGVLSGVWTWIKSKV